MTGEVRLLAWRSLRVLPASAREQELPRRPGRLCAAEGRHWLSEPSGAHPPDLGSALLPKAKASRPAPAPTARPRVPIGRDSNRRAASLFLWPMGGDD